MLDPQVVSNVLQLSQAALHLFNAGQTRQAQDVANIAANEAIYEAGRVHPQNP